MRADRGQQARNGIVSGAGWRFRFQASQRRVSPGLENGREPKELEAEIIDIEPVED